MLLLQSIEWYTFKKNLDLKCHQAINLIFVGPNFKAGLEKNSGTLLLGKSQFSIHPIVHKQISQVAGTGLKLLLKACLTCRAHNAACAQHREEKGYPFAAWWIGGVEAQTRPPFFFGNIQKPARGSRQCSSNRTWAELL